MSAVVVTQGTTRVVQVATAGPQGIPGDPGPQGDPGPVRSDGMVVVHHGSNAGTARPTDVADGAVYWVGTVIPSNMIAGDLLGLS